MKTKEFKESVIRDSLGEREFFVEKPHSKVHFYNGSLVITDLINAMKIGKYCESFSICYKGNDPWIGYNIMHHFAYNIWKLLELLKSLPWEKNRWSGWNEIEYSFPGEEAACYVYKSEEKGIRVYSPFATKEMKPLGNAPAKWTLRHALRALFNGQYEYLKCNGVYTDDYAYDYAVNYQMGEIKNGESFARRIMESPSGWWVYGTKDGIVHVSCHTFDNNEFKFKAA